MKSFAVVLLAIVLAVVFLYAGGLDYFRSGIGTAAPLRLTGTVAAEEVLISAKHGGRLEQLHVVEGSWVKAGAVVAQLDRTELDAEREGQLGRIDELTSRLIQAEEIVGLERARARRGTERAVAGLGAARKLSESSQAAREQKVKDLERTWELVEAGLSSREDLDLAQTALAVAAAEQDSLAERVREAEAELALARADERHVRVVVQDVDQSEAGLAQARAELKQIEARLADTTVRSPISGMVSRRVARYGEVIQAGAPIVTVIDLDDVWVRVDVEETRVHHIVVGQPVAAELPGGGTVQGRVTFVAPEAEFATQRDVSRVKRDIRTFAVKVAIPNPERRLHAGMTAYVLLSEDATAGSPPLVADEEGDSTGRVVFSP